MSRPLRFTGDFPPIELLSQYPNWEYALDEVGIEGQDETTIRPCQDQVNLTKSVAFTAGVVVLAIGTRLSAMLELSDGAIQGITAHDGANWAWQLRLLGRPARWEALRFEWLPAQERPPTVSLDDLGIFPLHAMSVLPHPSGSAATTRVSSRTAAA